MVLDGLETADCSSELDTVLYVVHGRVEHLLTGACHLRTLASSAVLEELLQNLPSAVNFAKDRRLRHRNLSEGHDRHSVRAGGFEFPGINICVVCLDQEQRDSVLRVLAGTGGNDQHVCRRAVLDEALLAVQDPAVLGLSRRHFRDALCRP